MQDVYAFGIILWEMLSFQAPYDDLPNHWQVGCRGLLAVSLASSNSSGLQSVGSWAMPIMLVSWCHTWITSESPRRYGF
jgi:hypothetical protein